MSDQVVTKEQIVKLIRDEQIRPEDLYTTDDLDGWRRRVQVEQDAKALAEREKTDNEDPTAKYRDPRRNPFIRLNPDL